MPQTNCQILFAERYFQILIDRMEAATRDALGKVNPEQQIVQTAAIHANEMRRKGEVTQKQVDLSNNMPNLKVNEWVSWVILVPASALRSQERLETVSGFVTAISSSAVDVNIQCNPQDSAELGYKFGEVAEVPLPAIVQIMKPQPITPGTPVDMAQLKDYVWRGI
jgi:hypothetical protein